MYLCDMIYQKLESEFEKAMLLYPFDDREKVEYQVIATPIEVGSPMIDDNYVSVVSDIIEAVKACIAQNQSMTEIYPELLQLEVGALT